MTTPSRVFTARLVGLGVFDPLGDQVGRVRDLIVSFGAGTTRPRVTGLVVEVAGRRRVFVPMTRITSLDGGQVITTGLVNMRRFETRPTETLVCAELLDRRITVTGPSGEFTGVVEDLAMVETRQREWALSQVFCRKDLPGRSSPMSRLTRRRGPTVLVGLEHVSGLHEQVDAQSTERLLLSLDGLRVADLAEAIHDLNPKRRAEVTAALDIERLADVLEELPADDQVEIIAALGTERAADVLEEMQPDDAADLLSDLPPDHAERLLALMEPGEAAPVRRLLSYDDNTAGGMMTSEPVILGPQSTIAEALAIIRQEEIPPALASTVFVCRPPLETPTGTFLGLAHIQRLLREPPHGAVGSIIDRAVEPLRPDTPLGTVTRELATYNLVSLPVVDEAGRLLGAVTVDDVLDHILPQDWREERHEVAHG